MGAHAPCQAHGVVSIYDTEGQGRGLAATEPTNPNELLAYYQMDVCNKVDLSSNQSGLFNATHSPAAKPVLLPLQVNF